MSDSIPAELRYSTDHEWARIDGNSVTIGITDYAQEALGDIVFVSLPALGEQVSAGGECGEVESTKSVSPLVSPVSGTVTAVNEALDSAPEAVNTDPYGNGWLFTVEVGGGIDAESAALLDAEGYSAHIS